MIYTAEINKILGITESYKAPATLMSILFDKEKRENVFRQFLEIDHDVDYDWFHAYFQDEHADRKLKKQDFTPNSVSMLLSRMTGNGKGTKLDVAAGTGGITIANWINDRNNASFFTYKPSDYFYHCEELSDRAIPFLLFNMLIRGMNGIVVHGDVLSRDIKQVYFIQNMHDSYIAFSDLNVMPHNETTMKEFDVRMWLEDAIEHIESTEWPEFLGGNEIAETLDRI